MKRRTSAPVDQPDPGQGDEDRTATRRALLTRGGVVAAGVVGAGVAGATVAGTAKAATGEIPIGERIALSVCAAVDWSWTEAPGHLGIVARGMLQSGATWLLAEGLVAFRDPHVHPVRGRSLRQLGWAPPSHRERLERIVSPRPQLRGERVPAGTDAS